MGYPGTIYLLDNLAPNAKAAQLGTKLNQIITLLNELKTQHDALCTKLDGDTGVTLTDYASVCGTTKSSVDTLG